MTKNLRGQHTEIERQALAHLSARTKLDDLKVSDVRSTELEDVTIYQVVASSELEPNANLVILVDEGGRELGFSIDDLVDRLSRIPFELLSDFGESAIPLRVGGGRDVQINPVQNELVLEEGEIFGPESIVVTISEGELKPKFDIYFLCDTTGSMRSALPSVRSAAGMVIDQLVASGADAAFGAGSYKDFFGGGAPFSNDARISTDPNVVRNAIAAWTASGGGDLAEAQLFAMDQIAEPPLGPIGWRAGTKSILIWFGDEPGHNPICQSISGLTYEITDRSVMQQLSDQMITVIAVDTGTGTVGLDGDPSLPNLTGNYSDAGCAPNGRPRQAEDISYWTGGDPVIQGLRVDEIVAGINRVLEAIVPQVPAAQVRVTGPASQFVAQISQVEHGPWQTTESIEFEFNVTFFGIVDCDPDTDQTFTGAIEIWIGDQLGAEKTLHVIVPRCSPTIIDDPVAITHWDKTTADIELGSFVRGEHDTLISCFFDPSVNNFVWNRHDTSRVRAGEVIEAMAVTYLGSENNRVTNEVYLFYVVASGNARRLLLMRGSPRLDNWVTTEEFINAQLRGRPALIDAGRIRELRRPTPQDEDENSRLFPVEDTVYVAMVGIDQELYTRPYGYRTLSSFTGSGNPPNQLLSDTLSPSVAYVAGKGPDFFAVGEFSDLIVYAAENGYFPHKSSWHNLGKQNPDGIVIHGPAVASESANRHFAFVTYVQFGVAVNVWDGDVSNTGAWKLLATPGGRSVQEVGQYAISAVMFPRNVFRTAPDADAFVFVNVSGELFCCSGNDPNGAWQWKSLGTPEQYALVGQPDATVWEDPQGNANIYVFMRGMDQRGHGHLFVCKFDGNATIAWIDLTETGVPLP